MRRINQLTAVEGSELSCWFVQPAVSSQVNGLMVGPGSNSGSMCSSARPRPEHGVHDLRRGADLVADLVGVDGPVDGELTWPSESLITSMSTPASDSSEVKVCRSSRGWKGVPSGRVIPAAWQSLRNP